jgi:uncharacterized protein with ParB-like and HNH nuclease domain
METNIKATDTLFGEFDRKASEIYYIPTLQRPYSWDTKQVEKLWFDILENDNFYYIGNIVAVSAEGNIYRDQIIDGQQRLTTLSLILVAIKNYISGKSGKNSKILKNIEDEILELLIKFKRGEEQIRLSFSNENSNRVYEAIVNNENLEEYKTETQRKFVTNLRCIEKCLREYSPKCNPDEIYLLVEKIKSLQLIFTRCENKSAAFKLFESINATAVQLATTDLIKSSIFEALHKNKKALKLVEDGWKEMYELFDEDSSALKKFIRHHWISIRGYTSHSSLYDDFIKAYKTEASILKYTESLFSSAKVYISLRNSYVESLKKLNHRRYDIVEIKETLQFLSFLGVDQIYSVLLYLYNDDSDDFKKDLIKLVAFQFLYKYVPGSPSVPERKYFADFCEGKISKAAMFEGLYKLCDKQEAAFVDSFVSKTKYVKGKSGDLQYVLERLAFAKGGTFIKKPTVEHIIPQDINDPIYKLFKNDQEPLKVIHSIGNLSLLEEDENSDVTKFNQEFELKKDLYKKHTNALNKNISKYKFDVDPAKAVKIRGEVISSEVYSIFLSALRSGKWKRI